MSAFSRRTLLKALSAILSIPVCRFGLRCNHVFNPYTDICIKCGCTLEYHFFAELNGNGRTKLTYGHPNYRISGEV